MANEIIIKKVGNAWWVNGADYETCKALAETMQKRTNVSWCGECHCNSQCEDYKQKERKTLWVVNICEDGDIRLYSTKEKAVQAVMELLMNEYRDVVDEDYHDYLYDLPDDEAPISKKEYIEEHYEEFRDYVYYYSIEVDED